MRFHSRSLLFQIIFLIFSLSAFAQQNNTQVETWVSSEFHTSDSQWFLDPSLEAQIPHKLDKQLLALEPANSAKATITIKPDIKFQTILGIGTSLEHTSIYAIRKNKTAAQQREVLNALINPDNGIGMNLFRITIGTPDFSDGTHATPAPLYKKGWYSLMDTPDSPFSIERDRNLGIIDTIKMAVDVGNATHNPLKIVASPWSPPAWMREKNNMVQGGPLRADMLDAYANYLRKFVESYQAEGIPIYAMTMQNERLFEPKAYPGMIISWQMERDLLIKVYENFHNIGGNYGAELNVKLWTLDHNFEYWKDAKTQMDSFKKIGKPDYVDATAFHHYTGNSNQMGLMHKAHPDKNVIFTEGSLWGLSSKKNPHGFDTMIQHFRNWATGYMYWVPMTTQTLNEANQSPYNSLGHFSPTLMVNNDGDNANWYRTADYWLLGQFSKFIKPGAVRIGSNYGSAKSITNVAFLNPDNSIVMVVANATTREQQFTVICEGKTFTASIPAGSIATYQWQSFVGK